MTDGDRFTSIRKSLSGWDFSRISDYLTTKELIPVEAEQAIGEYRRFIELVLTSEVACVPSKIVDEVWHTHMLHSRDYLAFSNALGVGYIHHAPHLPSDISDDAGNYRLTLAEYVRRFGEPISREVWGLSEDSSVAGACHNPCNGDCYGHGGCSTSIEALAA